jgi:hypothetical protein
MKTLWIRNVWTMWQASVFVCSSLRVCPSPKTLAYNEICPFPIKYKSVMFYSTGPSKINYRD